MSISNSDIRLTITSLKYVFWGFLIYIVDFSINQAPNGQGWKFDFLNDFVGMLMITWGVWRLAETNVSPRYQMVMRFVSGVAVLLCLDALHDHFIYEPPPHISFLMTVLDVAALIAPVLFGSAMEWLSNEMGLRKSAASWKTTTRLFLFIYGIPLGLFYCVNAFATGPSFSLFSSVGLVAILLSPIFALPLLHLFISTVRMQAEAESLLKVG